MTVYSHSSSEKIHSECKEGKKEIKPAFSYTTAYGHINSHKQHQSSQYKPDHFKYARYTIPHPERLLFRWFLLTAS
jgi:hypothetical protein